MNLRAVAPGVALRLGAVRTTPVSHTLVTETAEGVAVAADVLARHHGAAAHVHTSVLGRAGRRATARGAEVTFLPLRLYRAHTEHREWKQ